MKRKCPYCKGKRQCQVCDAGSLTPAQDYGTLFCQPTERNTDVTTDEKVEQIATEATQIVEAACGPHRLKSAEMFAQAGLDGEVIAAACKGTILFATITKGPGSIEELTENPSMAVLLGATLVASALNLRSGAVKPEFTSGG